MPTLLLTGAGFTKNFGGFLANEMFALIQTSVRSNPHLLRMLKATLNYEQVYGEVVIERAKGGSEERTTLLAAVEKAYVQLDDVIRRTRVGDHVSLYHLRKFVGKFAGRPRGERGYFFTLNQDLFVERHLGISAGDVLLHMDGQVPVAADLHHNPQRGLAAEDYVALDSTTYRAAGIASAFHYVKLHGSMNWRSSVNPNALVVGVGKEDLIAKEPLLAQYIATFDAQIYQDRRRLCVIGYGFRDEHINRRIANALERHDLQLFVISPQTPHGFREMLCGPNGVRYGHQIWERAVHWPWVLSEIFPRGMSIPERTPYAEMIENELFA